MMNVSNRTVALALIGWGACLVGAFWQLEWRYLRPVGRPAGAATYELRSRVSDPPAVPLATLDTDQGQVRLSGANPVTLINFWNPSCPCSHFAEPHVCALTERFMPDGVRFITVVECGPSAADREEALAAWRARGMQPMPVALDPGGVIARRCGVWAAPAAVILDRQGRLAYIGSYNAARFCADPATAWANQALEDVLAARPPRHASMPFYGCQVAAKTRG